jgi:hypothetical protein
MNQNNRIILISIAFLGLFIVSYNAYVFPIQGLESENVEIELTGFSVFPDGILRVEPESEIRCIISDLGESNLTIWIDLELSVDLNLSLSYQITEYWAGESLIERVFYLRQYAQSFFGEIHAYQEYTWFHFTFDTMLCQYNLDGISEENYDSLNIMPIQVEKIFYSQDFNSEELVSKEEKWNNILIGHVENFKVDHISIPSIDGPKGSAPLVTTTEYGLIHECLDANEESQFDDIADDWETYTNIDVGIHRYNPTESQILADLQTYTRDIYRNSVHISARNLLAYEMVAEGESDDSNWKLWGNRHWTLFGYRWDEYGEIYPSEIEALWGGEQIGSDLHIWYPTDCIILAYSSHSWGQYTHSNPNMGDAFVDYYADAFVGSITTISKSTTGDYSEVFWDVLSIDNDDVEDATRDLCTAGSWTYNTHWKILGDTSATLP